jgi:hypothetical protein
MAPAGNVTEEELYEIYEEQVSVLVEEGVDYFRITESDPQVLGIMIKAVRDYTDMPVFPNWLTARRFTLQHRNKWVPSALNGSSPGPKSSADAAARPRSTWPWLPGQSKRFDESNSNETTSRQAMRYLKVDCTDYFVASCGKLYPKRD